MRLAPDLRQAIFLKRRNRFAAALLLDGREVMAHVANSGRMHELLQPGNRCYLTVARSQSAGDRRQGMRKTAYDLALVDLGHTLVSADARLPSALLAEAILERRLRAFAQYDQVRREVVWDDSRIDLLLTGPSGRCLVEVKSVTLVEKGVGLFPDAPTERGRRHLATLVAAVGQGLGAAVVFVIQRDDAVVFAPNDAADPAFGQALRRAVAAGVGAYAFRCKVTAEEVRIASAIPVLLESQSESQT